MTPILQILNSHKDKKYGDFIAILVSTEERASFIGIRSPEYKKIMKEVEALPQDEIEKFMATLPHQFHEENVLHIVLIIKTKD